MSVTGKFETMPLVELLQWLGSQIRTGVLEVDHGRIRRRVVLRDGRIVACSSNDPSNRLGQFLISRGKIRTRTLEFALERQRASGGALGQILVESMLLLVIGLSIGNLLAWLTIKPLESGIDISIVAEGMAMFGASSMLYPQLRMEDVVLANVVVLILGFLASLSPAWRASRYEPIEAITKVD